MMTIFMGIYNLTDLIFVDTWAWIALYNSRDQAHSYAMTTYKSLLQQRRRLLTTNFVLAETYTLMRRQTSARKAIEFGSEIIEFVQEQVIVLVTITPEIEHEAWRLFEMYASVSGLSYTDCTSFAAMQARGLRQAFTNDEHFTMAGFERVPALD